MFFQVSRLIPSPFSSPGKLQRLPCERPGRYWAHAEEGKEIRRGQNDAVGQSGGVERCQKCLDVWGGHWNGRAVLNVNYHWGHWQYSGRHWNLATKNPEETEWSCVNPGSHASPTPLQRQSNSSHLQSKRAGGHGLSQAAFGAGGVRNPLDQGGCTLDVDVPNPSHGCLNCFGLGKSVASEVDLPILQHMWPWLTFFLTCGCGWPF